MATTYRTSDGDTVDSIAWKYYGNQTNRIVETVLAANPGLADYGTELPANIEIVLPEIDNTATATGTRLWT